ncbi:MAG: hypothetical protein KGJ86_20790 [Chloroflexota bacterium]|nr:hypothetical protein [Chloroflexota bacterium]
MPVDPICLSSPSVQATISAISAAKLIRAYCSSLTTQQALEYVIALKKVVTPSTTSSGERLWAFAGPPDDAIGVDGDSWLNLETSDIFVKQNGTYS